MIVSLRENLLIICARIRDQRISTTTSLSGSWVLALLLNLRGSLLLVKSYASLDVNDTFVNFIAVNEVIYCKYLVVWIVNHILSHHWIVYHWRCVWIVLIICLINNRFLLNSIKHCTLIGHLLLVIDYWVSVQSLWGLFIYETELLSHLLWLRLLMRALV